MPAQKTKKGRKYGRNKIKCARYRLEGRKEKNKARRIKTEENRQIRLALRKERKD